MHKPACTAGTVSQNLLLTGGTGAIGKLIAAQYSESGTNIILLGRNGRTDGLQLQGMQSQVSIARCDISAAEECDALLDSLHRHGLMPGKNLYNADD